MYPLARAKFDAREHARKLLVPGFMEALKSESEINKDHCTVTSHLVPGTV